MTRPHVPVGGGGGGDRPTRRVCWRVHDGGNNRINQLSRGCRDGSSTVIAFAARRYNGTKNTVLISKRSMSKREAEVTHSIMLDCDLPVPKRDTQHFRKQYNTLQNMRGMQQIEYGF